MPRNSTTVAQTPQQAPAHKGAKTGEKETPLMAQYNQIKRKYPNTILLFRIGDFYETFGEDAVKTAEILGIVLTKRRNGSASDIELAGFPHHAMNAYLPKLIRAGQRVAICDQLEDPSQAKTVVRRGITEVVTPGITMDDQLLENKRNNYLAALHYQDEQQLGAAFLEVSTGDFFCLSGSLEQIEKMLYSLRPAEVVVPRRYLRSFSEHFGEDFYTYRQEDWAFELGTATEKLLRHFEVSSLKGFGLEDEPLGTIAAGVLLQYLAENEQTNLHHITRIYRFADQQYVTLDKFTIRNLELLQPQFPDGRSLFEVLDRSATPMGGRLLRRWISFPLRDRAEIERRLRKVETLTGHRELREALQQHLRGIADLERLLGRLATRRLNPREALNLGTSLSRLVPIFETLQTHALEAFDDDLGQTADSSPARALLQQWLREDCPNALGSGEVIQDGVSDELDELRSVKANATAFLEQMRERERERTGINSLKVSYNKVFGYYIEITHAHKDKVPSDYIRKQTLTNAERYITQELKEFEDKIVSAEERIHTLETQLYQQLLDKLQPYIPAMQQNANLVAGLDVLLSFALTAEQHGYVRPELCDGTELAIEAGRHPVIEQLLPADQPYVPNDLYLDNEAQQILLISGPNMAGKSALLRQVALITLMAQMGAYVPASSARLGLVDKIFTRVGAADNVSAGESTFMVEMNEAARILHNASDQSLILLDEIGRGTSTFDGVSIAWSLVEYLHNNVGAKTLFATHYHELATLGDHLERVYNYNVTVKEVEGKIIFVRKLQPGHSAHSFGINVAQMAGLPRDVIERARELLQHFESHQFTEGALADEAHASTPAVQHPNTQNVPEAPEQQMQLFEVTDAAGQRIRDILANTDPERLTPMEALLRLQEIKQLMKGLEA